MNDNCEDECQKGNSLMEFTENDAEKFKGVVLTLKQVSEDDEMAMNVMQEAIDAHFTPEQKVSDQESMVIFIISDG